MKRNSMNLLHALEIVLWSFIGIGGGRKRGGDLELNPLILILIALVVLLAFVAMLVVIATIMAATS
jgi:hypothetical protein